MPNQENKVAPGTLTDADIEQEISKMNLPSNSKKYSNPGDGKRVPKVTKGDPIVRKKSFGRKLSETFLAEDMRSVGDYLIFDVLVPAVKDTVVNVVVNGINAFVYGDTRPRQTRFNAPYGNRPSSGYRDYSGVSRPRSPEGSFRSGNYRTVDNKEPICETKYEADMVLDALSQCIQEYDQATVGDLYDAMGYDSDHTDYKWGWTDLSTATTRKVSGGWLVDLPRPMRL